MSDIFIFTLESGNLILILQQKVNIRKRFSFAKHISQMSIDKEDCIAITSSWYF